MWTYLWVDLGAISIPLIYSFHPKLRFHREWGRALPAIAGMMLLFVPWDIWATARGVWGFNAQHLTGVQLLGLPVEEWLFFICIPYACLFTYHCFKVLRFPGLPAAGAMWATRLLFVASVAAAVLWRHQPYTAPTFALLAGFLLYVQLRPRPERTGLAFITYAILLLPFFVVNGILTGTGLDQPVVWYNEKAIWGQRLATIPVEDVFYGLLMFLLTVWLYEAAPWRALAGRRGVAATAFVLMAGSGTAAQGIDLDLVRGHYAQAARDPQACQDMLAHFQGKQLDPLAAGYLGAFEAMWAEHAQGPRSKLESFRRGTDRIDQAISGLPEEVELRFIRLSIQRNCPWILGYRSDQEEDERQLRAGLARVKDPVLRSLMVALLEAE